MKIQGNHSHDNHGATVRQAAKARSGVEAVPGDTATAAPTAPTPATAPAPTTVGATAPVESTVSLAARKLPPGLVRVAARLEAAGVEGRTGGQSNALAQITRNLQRYAETQGIVTPPSPLPDSPVVAPPDVDPVAPEASAPTDTTTPVAPAPGGGEAVADAILDAAAEFVEPAAA